MVRRGVLDELWQARRHLRMVGGMAESLWLKRKPVPPITAADAARGVRRLALREATVRIREAGTRGPTVVIVPDPPNTIEHYDEVVALLARDARVVVFEVPGFGLSYPTTARFDFSATMYTALTVEVLEHLGLRDVTLVYSCIGGYVALMVAHARPDLVARLVLNQTPAHRDMIRWAKRFDRLGFLGFPVVGQALMAVAKVPATRFWYKAALPEGSPDAARYAAPALAAQQLGGPYALASGIQAMRALDPAVLAGVAQPVTIVWGHADRTHAASDPRSLLEVVPHARFVSFDRAGHFPDLEDAARFSRLALDPDAR